MASLASQSSVKVIGANGQLTGYAGGLHRKAWLLQHEGWPNTQQQARLAL
jgi:hypothetical protein